MRSPSLKPIRVLLVDDSTLVRRGLQTVLGTATRQPIEVVGEAGTAAAALESVARLKPDVTLLDIRLPDGSGLDVCRRITKDNSDANILILTSFSSDSLIYDAVVAGARGYLMKEIDPAGLVEAVEAASAGRSVLAPDVTERVLRLLRSGPASDGSADIQNLSAQERRVLALVAEGQTNKEIAEKMDLRENTVKNYLVSVFEKLHVKRRSQAAAIFVQQGGGPQKTDQA
jgi:DNA-binding NarL/FixJ family response regulator